MQFVKEEVQLTVEFTDLSVCAENLIKSKKRLQLNLAKSQDIKSINKNQFFSTSNEKPKNEILEIPFKIALK